VVDIPRIPDIPPPPPDICLDATTMDPNLDPRALAKQNSFGRAIWEQIVPPKPTDLLGTGMAGGAAQIIQSRPYQLHVQEMQAQGLQPLPPEQWAAQQQSKGLLGQ
jgi:hypothetical protein